MRMLTRLCVVACAAMAALALALPAAAAPVTVNVGAALTLTGANDVYGLSSRRGFDMAAAEINAGAVPGVRFNVKTIDDLGTVPGASAAYGIFVRDGVSVIVGPTLSSVALTVDNFAQGANIPVVAVSNTLPGITEIGDYIFRASLTEQVVLPAVVKRVATSTLQPRTAVVIQGSDAFAALSAPILEQAITGNGIALTKTVRVPPFTTDFAAIAAEVKAADADIVAITALTTEGIPLLKALRAAGYRKKIIGSNAFNTQEIITGAGAAANGVIVGTPWSSANPSTKNVAFIKAFKKLYKRTPDQFAATAYAYAYVIAQAAKNGRSATPSSMRTQLAAITSAKKVPTLLGKFSFDASRNGVSPVTVQEILGGKFTLFTTS